MRRLPIRLRLALFISLAAAVLLSGVGIFGYLRLAAGFSADLNRELQQRAQDLIVPIGRQGASLAELGVGGFIERGESFAEVVTGSGRVLDATPTLHRHRLLSPAEAARARTRPISLDRASAPGLNEPARLLATSFSRHGHRSVLVVGDTRENGLEVLRRVRAQLLVLLPLLVLATFLGAYAVAGAALRPVESMRRRASEMTAADPTLRLPIPPRTDEISRLGETLNALLARVESTLNRERRFVAHASHELRTPLALLRTELELALRRPRDAAELRAAIGSASTEVDRLERLSEDLLLLAQSGDGRLSVQREEVPAGELFDTVRARFTPIFEQRGRQLTVVPTGVVLRGDRRYLQQALTNLIANALDHGDGTVRLQARQWRSQVDLVVVDRGQGFTPTMLTHATERFVHGRESQGAGLGLSIVAAIAEAHGGATGIRNLDQGAEAWISLPVPADASTRRRTTTAPVDR